jgi:hypothetical protein
MSPLWTSDVLLLLLLLLRTLLLLILLLSLSSLVVVVRRRLCFLAARLPTILAAHFNLATWASRKEERRKKTKNGD